MIKCGKDLALATNARNSQLSGVITSTFPPDSSATLKNCNTTIRNFPTGEVTVRLQVLFLETVSKFKILYDRTQSTDLGDRERVQFISISEQQLIFMYTSNQQQVGIFLIKFSGKFFKVNLELKGKKYLNEIYV